MTLWMSSPIESVCKVAYTILWHNINSLRKSWFPENDMVTANPKDWMEAEEENYYMKSWIGGDNNKPYAQTGRTERK